MIIAATGHRSLRARAGYRHELPFDLRLRQFARQWLAQAPAAVECISGMALGWDLAFAEAALELSLSLIAAIPHDNHGARWYTGDFIRLQRALSRASRVVVVSPGAYSASAMQRRNEWMVDRCDSLVALWDGVAKGGTWNCITYARARQRPMTNLWLEWQRFAEQ